MRGMQSAADPDRRALEKTGRNHQYFPVVFGAGSAPLSPAPIGWMACRVSAFFRMTAPALVRASPIGRKMTHTLIWSEARMKRSMPIFGPSQSETLRDHIWCEIHTAWGMESRPRTRPHAGERRRARTMPRAEGCCWGKNPIYKNFAVHVCLIPIRHRGKGAIYPHLLNKITELWGPEC